MKIKVKACVHNADKISKNTTLKLNSSLLKDKNKIWDCTDTIAYPPFINSHDHLISNWYPKAALNHPYPNVNVWVEEMKSSDSFLERNKVWINDGKFDLTHGTAPLIVSLGMYKNLFSGCAVVQDHIPKQKKEYYNNNPINVIKDYTQCHSLSMGNWWGGKTAEEEYRNAEGKMPFIIHIGEGIDEVAKKCFPRMEELDLLQPNTLIIHGIVLTRDQIKKCAESGTSICWCPESNLFLIGKTLDIDSCLEFGVNVILGTDSTMSGSRNILYEIKFAKKNFPHIPMKEIFRMISTNARKALFLQDSYGILANETSNLLLLKMKDLDPFENILNTLMDDIELFIHQGIPVYGDLKFLADFDIDRKQYHFFNVHGHKKFVKGHPELINAKIDSILGYHKDFPFFPF